jgi:hypothetical protein
MKELSISIYRQPKYDWQPLVKFGGTRYRTSDDGWHSYPLQSPRLRTMGGRLKDSTGTIKEYKVFHTGTYSWFNSQENDIVEVKYDLTKLTSLWYRYSYVSEILFDLNTAPEIEVLSFREHGINFGNLNIDNLYKLRKFEISRGWTGGITDVSFHPDAPIDYFYLDETPTGQAAIDSIILHAYQSSVNNGAILNDGFMPSQHLCDECEALISRGWSITTYPTCTRETAWRPIDPYCVQDQPPVMNDVRVNSKTDNTVTVGWDPATDDDGITSYEVSFRGGQWANWTVQGTTTGEILSLQVNNLNPETTYEIRVRAQDTAYQWSNYSTTISTTTDSVDNPPVIGQLRHVSSGHDYIIVEWDPATDDNGVVEYEVYAYNDFWGSTMLVGQTDGNTFNYTISDLHTGSYQIGIRAKDTIGQYSEFSNTVVASTTIPTMTSEDLPTFTFDSDWNLTDKGAVASGHNGTERSYTHTTIPSGGLWSYSQDGYSLRIDWEDSSNCGGNNSNIQETTANVSITASQEEPIYINWRGIAEKHDTGFESVAVLIDGNLIGEATSPGGQQGCEMGEIISTNNYPDGYTLTPGQHNITIIGNTGDGQYHRDAYYEFLFSTTPINDY